VVVLGRADTFLKVSARAPQGFDADFEQFMKSSAETFGGAGGGHKSRAGGEFPLSAESAFIASLEAL
ncbi:MAG: DHH family phosphoesterase, partial [Methanocorpusculum sp.]|nr:DHH family phosphoesterase [Methanocorpusculum sp.]